MFFFILRRPPGLSRTDPLLPYTPLFRSPKPVPRSRTGRREAVPHDHRCRLTTKDFNILQAMLEERRERDDPLVPLLREKLATAIVLPPQAVPADVVTLYSRVRYSRSEEHTSELQSLMRISYAVFCMKKKTRLHSYRMCTSTILI